MKIVREEFENISLVKRNYIDQFIVENNGLIFHETSFLNIVSKIFKSKLFYFILHYNSKIMAVCPIISVKNRFVNNLYSGPGIYEVPYGGWVLNNNKLDILELYKNMTVKFNENLLIKSNVQVYDDLNWANKIYINKLYTGIIDLTNDENIIWQKAINSKRRNMIKKALKSNIIIKKYGEEGLELFYTMFIDMHKKTSREKNLKPLMYYKDILKQYSSKKQTFILIAERNKEILSGIFLLGNKNMMHYWQGASKLGVSNLGQGELLQWEAIKLAKKLGCKYYDLCVIEENRLPNIAKFKKGFTEKIVPYYLFNKKNIIYRVINRLQ
ncbi:MAG: GNAT family N-acetyltransferase [Bacteroidales bacterium]|nr:GNAT family N-acetyltransferase [Bacteroidales bacterium]